MAVRYIAEHAPAVGLDEVFEFMGGETGIKDFDGKAMGGRMSAVGFARNAIGGGVGPIHDMDYNSEEVPHGQEAAAVLLEELDAYENA